MYFCVIYTACLGFFSRYPFFLLSFGTWLHFYLAILYTRRQLWIWMKSGSIFLSSRVLFLVFLLLLLFLLLHLLLSPSFFLPLSLSLSLSLSCLLSAREVVTCSLHPTWCILISSSVIQVWTPGVPGEWQEKSPVLQWKVD